MQMQPLFSLHIRQYEALRLVFTVGWREKENSGHRMRRRVRYMMDQQKIWEDNLKKNTAIENAIAGAGLKSALLVGKKIYSSSLKGCIHYVSQECCLMMKMIAKLKQK